MGVHAVSGNFCEQGVRDWLFLNDQDKAEQKPVPVHYQAYLKSDSNTEIRGKKYQSVLRYSGLLISLKLRI